MINSPYNSKFIFLILTCLLYCILIDLLFKYRYKNKYNTYRQHSSFILIDLNTTYDNNNSYYNYSYNENINNYNKIQEIKTTNVYHKLHLNEIKTSKTNLWVSANLIGRLGNQLFIAASSYGISKHRDATWCLDDVEFIDSKVNWLLETPKKCPSDKDNIFEEISDKHKHGVFMRSFLDEKRNSNVSINMFMQSFKYFIDYDIPFELSKKKWGIQWVMSRKISTGIHVRRGDYLVSEYHQGLILPIEYYAAAIQFIKNSKNNEIENSNIFVSSDDLDWIKSQDIFNGMILSNEGHTPEEDMAILSACDNLILGSGTFSWWSAYLSINPKGIKIYNSEPDKEIRSGSKVMEDYYPPNWIGIDNARIQNILTTTSEQKKCPITWVTSYFKIESKHSHQEYMLWLNNLFSMKMCLVIFTDNQEVIDNAKISTSNPLVIETNLKKEVYTYFNNFTNEFWNSQFQMDPEQNIHQSYELYWIWNLKPIFLDKVLTKTGFKSEFLFWIDAGLMRDSTYNGRDITLINPRINHNQVYFGLVNSWQESFPTTIPWCDGPSFTNTNRLMGGIFGCHKSMVKQWLHTYTEVINQYIKCDRFIGKDQSMMNTVCLRFDKLCHFIETPEINENWYALRSYILD
jgi:hypothetical protein